MVEHTLGKGEVTGSIPVASSEDGRFEVARFGVAQAVLHKPHTRNRDMPRDKIILACNECKNRNYFTTKNKRTHPERVECKKYCPRCNKHQKHKETK